MMVNQSSLPLSAAVPSSSASPPPDGVVSQLHLALAQCRPWSELVDRNSLSKPASIEDAVTRLRQNFAYFRYNYALVIAIAVGASLFSQPFSFITLLGLIAAWIFLYFLRTEPIRVFNRTVGDKEVLVALLILTVVLVFASNMISTVFSAVAVGLGLAAVHAVFRMPEEALFIEEPVAPKAGYASFQGSYQSAVLNRV